MPCGGCSNVNHALSTRPMRKLLSGATTIHGWPSVGGIRGRTEPTGLAIMALCRNQLAGHPRIADGVRWLLARSLASGGWNTEEATSSGPEPYAHAGPTGIILLALCAAGLAKTAEVMRACHYLARILPQVESPEILSWGLLGYSVWQPRPAAARHWLHRSYTRAPGLADSPTRLALLVLAASSATYPLLGVCCGPRGNAVNPTGAAVRAAARLSQPPVAEDRDSL